MKCFLGVILIFHAVVDLGMSALIGSTIKSLVTLPDTGKQNVCKSGVKIFCHKEVKSNITPTLSKMCVDGKIQLVRIPEGYTARTEGLDRCTYAGKTFCDGDNILPNYKGWSTKHFCLKGNIRFSVSGRRLKTNKSTISRPSSTSSSSNVNDKKDKPKKPSFQKPSFQKPSTTKKPFSFTKKPFSFTKKPQMIDEKTPIDANDTKTNNSSEDVEDSAQKKPPFSQCK